MKEERTSNVIVRKVDMTSVLDNALEYWNKVKTEDTWERMDPYSPIGIVDTTEGLYVLCEEGVGDNHAMKEDEPYSVELYGHSKAEFGIFPSCTAKVPESKFREMSYVEVNLADFVRRFGHRLESNFNCWNRKLNPIAIKGDL